MRLDNVEIRKENKRYTCRIKIQKDETTQENLD